jgi:hypothetical protein
MRRLLVPLILLLTFLALGAWSGSAGAIVCPEASDSAFTCCGPVTPNPGPSAGCCPSSCCGTGAAEPACPVALLTISSSRNPSLAGLPLTISGRLESGASGQTVELWQELSGQTAFKRVAQTTTDGSGGYKFTRGLGVVNTNVSWYAKAGSATSARLLEHVRAYIGLTARARGGRVVAVSGYVMPVHAGERITLQQQTAKGWRTIATARLGSKSRFFLRHRFAHRGATTLRALLSADARNLRSGSRPVSVTVR